MKKILFSILYIVVWFILFNVTWILGGMIAFNMNIEISLKAIIWSGFYKYVIFITIMFLIGFLPILLPAILFKELKIAPIIAALFQIIHCIYVWSTYSGIVQAVAYLIVAISGAYAAYIIYTDKIVGKPIEDSKQ